MSRRRELGLLGLLVAVYLLLAPGHLYTVDSVEVYRTAESLVRDHDLEIERPYPLPGVDTKHFHSKYGPLQALLATPLYLVGETASRIGLGNFFSRDYPQGFGGDVHIYFVSLFNVAVTALTALVLARILARLGYAPAVQVQVALIYGLATMALNQARDFFQHPLETLLLLLAFAAVLAFRQEGRPLWALATGAALGAALLTRLTSALVWPAYAMALAWALPAARSKARAIVGFVVPLLVAASLQLAYNQIRYASPWRFGYLSMDDAQGFSTPLGHGLAGNLLSAGRGLFLYAPPLVVALAMGPRFLARHRAPALLALAQAAAFLVVSSTWWDWAGGWCWGPRLILAALPALFLPLALVLSEGTRSERGLLAATVAAGVLVALLGALVDYNSIYWTWAQMKLHPADAYLWQPSLSPVVMHAKALTGGAPLDLWLADLVRRRGLPTGLATGLPLVALGATSLALVLRRDRDEIA